MNPGRADERVARGRGQGQVGLLMDPADDIEQLLDALAADGSVHPIAKICVAPATSLGEIFTSGKIKKVAMESGLPYVKFLEKNTAA